MNQSVKLEAMMSRLAEYTRTYRETEEPKVQRDMWRCTLQELIFFMDDLQPDWMPSSILVELIDDLCDLKDGMTSQRLTREVKTGRPHYCSYEIVQLVTQSALIDFQMWAGMSKEEAAKKVARKAKKLDVPLPKSTKMSDRPDYLRLLDWRARQRSSWSEKEGSNLSKVIYRWWCDHYERAIKRGLSEKQAADYMLDELWPFRLGIKKSDVRNFFGVWPDQNGK